ncbi:MAG: hypothetical protein RMH84_01085 [Sulfolobales archaeon]|nr:hypothetical protein [Sulfolobales archaeon]MCX8209203.1 hypothetical protein [Sulfolobales archaeon]MDW8010180.1 hypothetical protein [Sulfolobales archaeon]
MFCAYFLGNLASQLGPAVCLELGECMDVLSLLDELLRSREVPLSVDELLVTLPDGRPIPPRATTCDVEEVRVLRLLRGG